MKILLSMVWEIACLIGSGLWAQLKPKPKFTHDAEVLRLMQPTKFKNFKRVLQKGIPLNEGGTVAKNFVKSSKKK